MFIFSFHFGRALFERLHANTRKSCVSTGYKKKLASNFCTWDRLRHNPSWIIVGLHPRSAFLEVRVPSLGKGFDGCLGFCWLFHHPFTDDTIGIVDVCLGQNSAHFHRINFGLGRAPFPSPQLARRLPAFLVGGIQLLRQVRKSSLNQGCRLRMWAAQWPLQECDQTYSGYFAHSTVPD